jgi:hypothetical protein
MHAIQLKSAHRVRTFPDRKTTEKRTFAERKTTDSVLAKKIHSGRQKPIY